MFRLCSRCKKPFTVGGLNDLTRTECLECFALPKAGKIEKVQFPVKERYVSPAPTERERVPYKWPALEASEKRKNGLSQQQVKKPVPQFDPTKPVKRKLNLDL